MTVAITEDGFLGGRLRLRQPARGYRSGVEPVFLAAAVEAQAGERVLELGCGVGAALYCLGTRVPGLELTGVERDPGTADLARANAAANGIAARIVDGDALDLPDPVRGESFDHVIANPPWLRSGAGPGATVPGRDGGRRMVGDVGLWVKAARRRARPGGRIALILPVGELPAALVAAEGIGAMVATPFASRAGRAPATVILSGRKGARAPFVLTGVVTVHSGARHAGNGDDFTPEVRAVLRDGHAWSEVLG